MKIEGTKLSTETKVSKVKKKKSSSLFSLDDDNDSSSTSSESVEGSGSIGFVGNVDPTSFVAIQSLNTNEDKKYQRYAISKGREALDELSKLQKEILLGDINATRLLQIDKEISKINAVQDQQLKGIIEFIKQRVKVELAKLGLA